MSNGCSFLRCKAAGAPFIAEILNVWSFTFMSLLCLCCMVVEHSLNSLTGFDQSFSAFWETLRITCIDKFNLFWMMMWIVRSVGHVCFSDCIQSMIKQWTTWPTFWRMKEKCMRQSVFFGKLCSSGKTLDFSLKNRYMLEYISIALWNSRDTAESWVFSYSVNILSCPSQNPK